MTPAISYPDHGIPVIETPHKALATFECGDRWSIAMAAAAVIDYPVMRWVRLARRQATTFRRTHPDNIVYAHERKPILLAITCHWTGSDVRQPAYGILAQLTEEMRWCDPRDGERIDVQSPGYPTRKMAQRDKDRPATTSFIISPTNGNLFGRDAWNALQNQHA